MSQEINQIRQGDLLFERLDEFDKYGQKASLPLKDGNYILAEGEKTGHVHTIPETAVEDLFSRADGIVIVVAEDTEVTHDEHPAAPLTEGNWFMRRQEEYVPQDRPRPVID